MQDKQNNKQNANYDVYKQDKNCIHNIKDLDFSILISNKDPGIDGFQELVINYLDKYSESDIEEDSKKILEIIKMVTNFYENNRYKEITLDQHVIFELFKPRNHSQYENVYFGMIREGSVIFTNWGRKVANMLWKIEPW